MILAAVAARALTTAGSPTAKAASVSLLMGREPVSPVWDSERWDRTQVSGVLRDTWGVTEPVSPLRETAPAARGIVLSVSQRTIWREE